MSNSSSDDLNCAIESLEQVIRQNLQDQCSVERLLIETQCTNCLQRLIDFVNAFVLKNFSLRLQMDCDDSDKCHLHSHYSYDRSEVLQGLLNL
jgi:hypothetical protein